ncbi:Tsr1 protein [Spraguea lophii 42_110]|uniref:Tsr1 protein n=1 Tax=Spraguea lophii (strain 42_110) TaxID=1358809 RepID=S7XV42_SPRLO|nr:Tsr1 protein [Spraguea lophii 42_110]
MKKAIKKNKSLQKRRNNVLKHKEQLKNYNKTGYITITTLNISPLYEYNDVEQNIIDGIQKEYYDIKNKLNYNIIDGNGLPEHEFIYNSRFSDITIFFMDKIILEEIKNNLDFIFKNCKNIIFCINNNTDKKDIKIMADRYNAKITSVINLFNYIPTIKLKEDNIRSVLFPTKVTEDEDTITIKSYLKKGLVSKNFVCNGMFNLQLEQIEVDGEIITAENLGIEGIEYAQEIIENEEIDEEECSSGEYEEDTDDDESEENNQNNYDGECNLIEKYKNYRGIKNIGTCDYKTDDYPEYYKDITFFQESESVERKLKATKPVFSNKIVQIKFRKLFKGSINAKSYVFCNLFLLEDKLTLLNVPFVSTEESIPDEIIIDLGCRIFKVKPLITNDSNDKVFIENKEYGNMFSFIIPFTLDQKSSCFFKEDFSVRNIIGKIHNGYYGDRIILDRIKLIGYPIKFYKRECKIKNMFNTRDEVLYFRKMALKSKTGINGRITKPVGLSGIFKAYFERPVKNGEPIYTFLYKRIYPTINF